MKVVYIAGPFRGANSWEVENNIRRAEELALKVWELGAAAICPHCNTRFFQGVGPDERWLKGDLAIIAKCDAVMMTLDWNRSRGARGEWEEAMRLGIPVFFDLGRLKEWLDRTT
jgi:hypothetical protein